MNRPWYRSPRLWLIVAGLFLLGGFWFWDRQPRYHYDETLSPYVTGKPAFPIVFTSRTEPYSLIAPAPEGEGFAWPGQKLWAAREGRLRLLTTAGQVVELTWDRICDNDGGRIIDVMSPSISHDGRHIVFAGRTERFPYDRFRIYEMGIDGRGLHRITGGNHDSGCSDMPPLRTGADGGKLSDFERRIYDYDDIDPTFLSDGRIAFASSRTPDLGRGHARRSTQIWVMNGDGSDPRAITANRNNDRWPFLMSSGYLAFSLWSRNTEVITDDLTDVRPQQPGIRTATLPSDSWMGAMIDPVGERFGNLIKVKQPVWRPRPLFNGHIAFMSPTEYPLPPEVERGERLPWYTIHQGERSLVLNSPSALPAGDDLPRVKPDYFWSAPTHNASGQRWSLATPSPFPDYDMVVSIATSNSDTPPNPTAYGIALIHSNWQRDRQGQILPEQFKERLLFNDPRYVDAEPVAVYLRPLTGTFNFPEAVPGKRTANIELANGQAYTGKAGNVVNPSLFIEQNPNMPGNIADTGSKPIFAAPPIDSIQEIRYYASYRDRFDAPLQTRIEGKWELLTRVPVQRGGFDTWVPSGVPTVLAGFDANGKVVKWTSPGTDSEGTRATKYAIAGDHYSSTKAGMHHFCLGCHPGHSSAPVAHTERMVR